MKNALIGAAAVLLLAAVGVLVLVLNKPRPGKLMCSFPRPDGSNEVIEFDVADYEFRGRWIIHASNGASVEITAPCMFRPS